MKTYKCHKCNKIFKNKNDYKRHTNRKTECNKNTQLLSQFTCDKCNKVFTRKFTLDRHILSFCKFRNQISNSVESLKSVQESNSQVVIDQLDNNNDINLEDIDVSTRTNSSCASTSLVPNKNKKACMFCLKSISASNLAKHIKKCKIRLQFDKQKEGIFQQLLKEKDEMDKKMNELEKKIEKISDGQTISTTNTNSNTINNTVNNSGIINNNNIEVKLVAYGKEDRSYLTEKDYMNILNKGFQSVPELVKYIHFNKNRPENFNIYISNMRDSYIMVFNGKKWVLQNKKETLDDLYNTKRDILTEKYEELVKDKKLPEKTIRKFDRFVNDEQDKKIADGIKDEVKLILYNNKNMVEQIK